MNMMRYYPFMVNLERCNGSCNSLNDPSGRICVANKTEYINLNVFNMITRINETLTKGQCKLDGRKCNSNQMWNSKKCRCECKNLRKHHVCEKDYSLNPSTCACEKW